MNKYIFMRLCQVFICLLVFVLIYYEMPKPKPEFELKAGSSYLVSFHREDPFYETFKVKIIEIRDGFVLFERSVYFEALDKTISYRISIKEEAFQSMIKEPLDGHAKPP